MAQGRFVLLVDDDEDALRLLSVLLTRNRYNVLTAENGMEAVRILEARGEEIDVVILDLIMPGALDGYAVCEWIQSQDAVIREIPVIVLSAKSAPGEMARTYASGAFQHITKPYDVHHLLAVVDGMVRLRHLQDQARNTAERFAAIFENAPHGMLVVNADYEVLEMSRVLREMHPDVVPGSGVKAYEVLYDPPRASPYPGSPLAAALQDGRIHRDVLRIDQAGGKKWWDMSAAPLRDKKGRITGAVLIVGDMTREHEAESRLRREIQRAHEAENQFRALFEGMSDPVLVHDLEGRILMVNEAACRHFGYAGEELLRMHTYDLEPSESAHAFSERLRAQLDQGRASFELVHLAKGERRVPVDVNTSVIEYRGHKAVLCIVRDITRQKKAEERLRRSEQRLKDALVRQDAMTSRLLETQRELRRKQVQLEEANIKFERLSITDELTGLYNRRHFNATFAIELRRAIRYNHPLSVVMMDIDHFKRVNDVYGHLVGDEVLRGLGRVLDRYVRETDITARYGGEEFIMGLPETPAPLAARLAERMRQGVAEKTFEPEKGDPFHVTVSLGVATREDEVDPQALVAKADAALYAAKEAGRNRVVMDSDR